MLTLIKLLGWWFRKEKLLFVGKGFVYGLGGVVGGVHSYRTDQYIKRKVGLK